MKCFLEQRYAIKFCVKLGKIGKLTHDNIYGYTTMGTSGVFEWYKLFRVGGKSGRQRPPRKDLDQRRFVEWAQNEIAVVPDFYKRILFNDEAHFWLNGYVNKQNCRIWSEASPQVYVETPLHPEKLTVWCALWAGGILLQKR
ncbi:transposable element Tc3 transposase [Trichonephila clavipes]|nr:transposable element Tc3 transposase [Trichonephila clavipes]